MSDPNERPTPPPVRRKDKAKPQPQAPVEEVPAFYRLSSIEAEWATLGCMLISSAAVEKALELVAPADFHLHAHQRICEAIVALESRNEAVDVLTVQLELGEDLAKLGGMAYLLQIMDSVPTAAHVEYYARQVAKLAHRRRLREANEENLAESTVTELEPEELQARAEARLVAAASKRTGRDYSTTADLAGRWGESLETPKDAIATGWAPLDEHLRGGLRRQRFYVVGGRPGMAKTAFLCGLAVNVSKREGMGVALFSMEMSRDDIFTRLLSIEGGIDGAALENPDMMEPDALQAACQASARLSDRPIFVDDRTALSLSEIRRTVRRMQRRHPLAVVGVDYLTLMSPDAGVDAENWTQRFTQIAQGLKDMSKDLDVSVVALAQLSRAVERRDNKRPLLSDLRESGGIEQAADVVIGLYRGAYYGRFENPDIQPPDDTEFGFLKFRQGSMGTVNLDFHPTTQRFSDPATRHGDEDVPYSRYADRRYGQ